MDPADPLRTALRQYGRARDPLERLALLATLQRLTPAALAAAVDECRAHGNGWSAIGGVLNLSRTALYDQHRARAIQAHPEREDQTA